MLGKTGKTDPVNFFQGAERNDALLLDKKAFGFTPLCPMKKTNKRTIKITQNKEITRKTKSQAEQPCRNIFAECFGLVVVFLGVTPKRSSLHIASALHLAYFAHLALPSALAAASAVDRHFLSFTPG